MSNRSPRVIFFYLLVPAIFVIFVYSFMFARFSNLSHLHASYRPGQVTNDAFHSVVGEIEGDSGGADRLAATNATRLVINTLDDYLHLDLNPNDTSFWSAKLDRQYQHAISQSQFPLKVIIVPHSHNDPGWLNTFDQYYYRYTYYILDNMVKNLVKPEMANMTFIWPEMSFFSRWWDGLSDADRQKVKNLLQGKRFEIVTGGWVMTDEAAAHYMDMLEQLIEGHQFLRTTLNYTPKNSWSIDPFGHSGTLPYLLQKSGLSNMYIQRTHFAWKRRLAETRSLEFFWRQFFETPDSNTKPMMCHMSPLDLYSYKYACGPDFKTCLNFDFRKIFGESSESTAVELNSTNIDAKAREILGQYAKLGSLFPHNVALVLLGDDFRYDLDTEWRQQYDNYNLLMNYVNSNGAKFQKTQIQFGTLESYFEAVNTRMPIKLTTGGFPSLFGDFIPYSDVYVSAAPNYWTGYYSTRPLFKSLNRELQHWLRAAEILYTLSRNHMRTFFGSSISNILDKHYRLIANARQNLSLFQHHDGITGTSRDFVMEDYGRRMAHSIGKMMEVTALSIQLLNAKNVHSAYNVSKPFIFSHQHKSSWNRITERRLLRVPAGDSGLKLMLFNTHLQSRTETVRILVEDPFVKVFDVENNARVDIQINPIYSGRQLSSNTFELEFIAVLYPLSLKNYKVLTNEESIQAKVKIVEHKKMENTEEQNAINNNNNNVMTSTDNEVFVFEKSSSLYLENDLMRIEFNKAGFIERLHFKDSNTTEQVEMSFAAYHSKPTESGAYLFKPNVNSAEKLFTLATPQINLFKGKVSSTILVNYSDIAYSMKLHNSPSAIGAAVELKVLVDLNSGEYNDREVILRISTPIRNIAYKSNGQQYRTFYVDSNGFTMLQRNFIPETGIEGNYYPMTTAIFIEDATSRLTVLSSSSHGVTSSADGAVEIMLDRRIIEDDRRGLSQGIQDNLPVELSFWLVFERWTQQPLPSQENTDHLGKLSFLADSLLLQLNYPSVVMYSYKGDREVGKEGTSYFTNQYLIAPNLLCEYFLLNLRTLPAADNFVHPSNSSLLLLHNRASWSPDKWQPRYPMGHHCDTSSAVLSKQGLHLFNGLRVASVEASSLTGLQSMHRFESLSQIQVPPFELAAFKVTCL